MSPGMTVRPARSTVSAPAGTSICRGRTGPGDAIPFDEDAAVLDRLRAASVDDPDVVEDQQAWLRGFRHGDGERDRCAQRQDSNHRAQMAALL